MSKNCRRAAAEACPAVQAGWPSQAVPEASVRLGSEESAARSTVVPASRRAAPEGGRPRTPSAEGVPVCSPAEEERNPGSERSQAATAALPRPNSRHLRRERSATRRSLRPRSAAWRLHSVLRRQLPQYLAAATGLPRSSSNPRPSRRFQNHRRREQPRRVGRRRRRRPDRPHPSLTGRHRPPAAGVGPESSRPTARSLKRLPPLGPKRVGSTAPPEAEAEPHPPEAGAEPHQPEAGAEPHPPEMDGHPTTGFRTSCRTWSPRCSRFRIEGNASDTPACVFRW